MIMSLTTRILLFSDAKYGDCYLDSTGITRLNNKGNKEKQTKEKFKITKEFWQK